MKQDKKQNQIRKNIWKMPFLINGLFKDEDWHKFDDTTLGDQVPKDEMKQFIQQAIQQEEERQERKILRKARVFRLLRYTAAAAIVAFFSFQAIFWYTKDVPSATAPIVGVTQDVPRQIDTVWTFIENKEKQQVKIHLPDGSGVTLYANSSIRFVKDFTEKARHIQLSGKAYFKVASDAQRPFSVFAAGTKTTALGTSFTINTNAKALAFTVALHTGKILISSVSNSFKQVFLNESGQQLSLNKQGEASLYKPSTAIRSETAIDMPHTDLLNLENVPMPDVLHALEMAFPAKIHIGDKSIAQIHYTGEINTQKDQLKDILATICLINELRYVINPDNSYTLYEQENTITEHLKN